MPKLEILGIRYDFQAEKISMIKELKVMTPSDSNQLDFGLLHPNSEATLIFKINSNEDEINFDLYHKNGTGKKLLRLDRKQKDIKNPLRINNGILDLKKDEAYYLKVLQPGNLTGVERLILKPKNDSNEYVFPIKVQTKWQYFTPLKKEPLRLKWDKELGYKLFFPLKAGSKLNLPPGTTIQFRLNNTLIQKELSYLNPSLVVPISFKEANTNDTLTVGLQYHKFDYTYNFDSLSYPILLEDKVIPSKARKEGVVSWFSNKGFLFFLLSLLFFLGLLILLYFYLKKEKRPVPALASGNLPDGPKNWIEQHLDDFIRKLMKGEPNHDGPFKEIVNPVLAPFRKEMKSYHQVQQLDRKADQEVLINYLQGKNNGLPIEELPPWFKTLMTQLKERLFLSQEQQMKELTQLKSSQQNLNQELNTLRTANEKINLELNELRSSEQEFKKINEDLKSLIQKTQDKKQGENELILQKEQKIIQLEKDIVEKQNFQTKLFALLEDQTGIPIQEESTAAQIFSLMEKAFEKNTPILASPPVLEREAAIPAKKTPVYREKKEVERLTVTAEKPIEDFELFVSNFERFMERLILELKAIKNIKFDDAILNDIIADIQKGTRGAGIEDIKEFFAYEEQRGYTTKYDELVFEQEFLDLGPSYRSTIDRTQFFDRVVTNLLNGILDHLSRLQVFIDLDKDINADPSPFSNKEDLYLIEQVYNMIVELYEKEFNVVVVEIQLLESTFDPDLHDLLELGQVVLPQFVKSYLDSNPDLAERVLLDVYQVSLKNKETSRIIQKAIVRKR